MGTVQSVSASAGPVVATTAGQLGGVDRGPVAAWLGVPYAAPPVGPRRFRAPEPVDRWSGVRPARTFGGAAVQSRSRGATRGQLGTSVTEDALYLNVYAPRTALTDGRPRPVLVWLHGGAFTSGSGALYDGGPLAAAGDVVVVTLNYRLGVFGFVDFSSALDVAVPSNLGLRDQVAALRWVQENIAAFGGDPAQVTVAGESAGSISVSLLLGSSHTEGLFRAAILQSGALTLVHGDEVRVEVARHYARLLGLGRRDGDRLWQLPPSALAAAQRVVGRTTPGSLPGSPWFDGDLVAGSLEVAQRAVRPGVALLAGTNREEITYFSRLPGDIMPTSRAALTARLRAALGWEAAEALLAHYPAGTAGTTALGTDVNFAMPTLHVAERHARAGGRTFFYRFDAGGPLLGATHAAELVYLWGWPRGAAGWALRGRRTPERDALVERLRSHWLAFVRDGSPQPDWPAFTLPERATRIFDPAGNRTEHDPERDRRQAWAGRDVLPRP